VITAVTFLVAAAAGALARVAIAERWNREGGAALGTLVVNVTGSFLLGLLVTTAPPLLTVLGTGALGAFTTFSGFARDVVCAIEQRRIGLVIAYVGMTCVFGILAAAAGVALAEG
jgi:CrcB protein